MSVLPRIHERIKPKKEEEEEDKEWLFKSNQKKKTSWLTKGLKCHKNERVIDSD